MIRHLTLYPSPDSPRSTSTGLRPPSPQGMRRRQSRRRGKCTMNRHRKTHKREPRQSLLERIEAFLDQHNEQSNVELIRQMRQSYFADVDALEKSGAVKIPK